MSETKWWIICAPLFYQSKSLNQIEQRPGGETRSESIVGVVGKYPGGSNLGPHIVIRLWNGLPNLG